MGSFFSDVTGSAALSLSQFLADVFTAIQGFGGLGWSLKIAVVCLILVGTMKVTVLDDLIWSKLGNFQTWAAPVLGLILGIVMLGASGGSITLANVFAYMASGSGAILLHELLSTIAAIPGLGSAYVNILNLIASVIPDSLSSSRSRVLVQKKA